ncbi:MAG: hypothetical protein C4326_06410 [Ignavibacteria bacterium]
MVVELTRLGDVITMMPALRLLVERFPQARFCIVVEDRYAAFLRDIRIPGEIVGIKRPETLVGFLRALKLVRTRRADLVLNMSPPKRNAAVALASGAPRIVGYLTYVDSLTPYLETTPIESFGCVLERPASYGRQNIEERSLAVCTAFGIDTQHARHDIALAPSQEERVRSVLIERGLLPQRRFIVIHPFSGWTYRSWPLERFMELVERMLAVLPDYDMLFVCEEAQAPSLAPVSERFANGATVRVFASSDLLQTAFLMKHAALVVANDSGPLHLAAALGTPVVGLFGPASPELTAPRTANGTFVYERVECSPCTQFTCVRPEQWCMRKIATHDVLRSVVARLSAQPVVQATAHA